MSASQRHLRSSGRVVAVLALLLVPVLTWDEWLGERLSAIFAGAPAIPADHSGPDPLYSHFLQGARERTRPAERVLLVLPPALRTHAWHVFRAEWIFADRTLTPLYDPTTGETQEVGEFDLVLFWATEPDGRDVEVVWRNGPGVLARRR